MAILIFLLMNSVVALSSFILTYRLFNVSGFIDSLICWFILYFAQIAATELVLGVTGSLYLHNLIFLNLAFLSFVWLIAGRRAFSFNPGQGRDVIRKLLKNKAILLGVCVILCFGLVKVFINLANPPFGWDSLNYHFTFPVEWLKHANLDNPITISDDPSPSYYPVGGSLFFLWLIFPFKSVFLADIGQVPFFILAFLSAYSISRKLNLNEELSLLAAVLFFTIPNFFKQLQIAYVDVMLAALFLACVDYLLILGRDFSLKNILVLSLSLGLFLSTKTIALPYAALLIIPFMYLAAKNPGKSYLFIVSALIVIAIGGFSYIRNFIDTGNPLYPLNLSLSGKPVLNGVIDAGVYRAHFKIEDYRISKLLFHEGLGAQSLLLVVPSFLALPLAFIKRRKTLDFNLVYILILPVLIYLLYRYVIPLANTRYLYPFLGIGVIAGVYLLVTLNIPGPAINILSTICIISSMAELAKRQELVFSAILTILLFAVSVFLIKSKRKIFPKASFVITALSISILILLPFLQNDYKINEYQRYIKMVKYSGFWPDATSAWYWLNDNTQGNNIAYVGRPVPFPLYGENFKNNVYYTSVNKTDPAKLHYFPHSRYYWDYDFLSLHKNLEAEGNYRADADYSEWLKNLIGRRTDYLFIYSLHQTKDIVFPVEDSWARANAADFSPVFANQTIHIYKVIR